MKTLLLISLHLALLNVNAQGVSSAIIDVNQFSAKFFANGNQTNLSVPKDSGVQALFAGNLWIGGFDNTFGVLHISSMQYGDSLTNFRPGPIANSYNSAYVSRYNKVWKITQFEIDYHAAHYNDIGYTALPSITDWPANGNTANGEPALLAPFADLNGNFLYEPGAGEYPLIKGDEALYIIYSDRANPNNVLYGNPLNVDVHLMVYAFDNFHGEDLKNTLFLHYNIINRNNDGYRDVLIGSWNDFDLGCFSNDRVGCDSLLNTFFVYNDGNDPDCNGVQGYGNLRTSLGVTFLNQPMYTFAAFLNGAHVFYGDPVSPFQKYYAMNALWYDGSHFTNGGNGYASGSPTNYLFNGNPCNATEWSEASAGLPAGDRRAMGSTGKFNLGQGANMCVDLAYVFETSNAQTSCSYDAVDSLKKRIQRVQAFYNSSAPDCISNMTGIEEWIESGAEMISVFPNPASDGVTISIDESLVGSMATVSDIMGRKLLIMNIEHRISNIETGNFANGVYFVTISASDGRSATKKLVVSH